MELEGLTGIPWLASNAFAYPALESLHIAGIALLVGNLVLLELRVWGLAPELPLRPLARLSLRLALSGFAVLLLSGGLMFAANPGDMLANRAFVVKMALIALGGLNAALFHARGGLDHPDRFARGQTVLSLGGAMVRGHHLRPLDRLPIGGFAMHKRNFIAGGLVLVLRPAFAHHGWSSFDQTRPLYVEGQAAKVAWRNPHAEIELEVAPDLKLPAGLAGRALPAQSAPVDGPALLKTAALPTRKDRRWHIELAPIARMESWKVPEIRPGETVAILGFTFPGEKGEAVLRAEYLFAGGKIYGLRSAPA